MAEEPAEYYRLAFQVAGGLTLTTPRGVVKRQAPVTWYLRDDGIWSADRREAGIFPYTVAKAYSSVFYDRDTWDAPERASMAVALLSSVAPLLLKNMDLMLKESKGRWHYHGKLEPVDPLEALRLLARENFGVSCCTMRNNGKKKRKGKPKRRSVETEMMIRRRLGTGGSGPHGEVSRRTQRRKDKQKGWDSEGKTNPKYGTLPAFGLAIQDLRDRGFTDIRYIREARILEGPVLLFIVDGGQWVMVGRLFGTDLLDVRRWIEPRRADSPSPPSAPRRTRSRKRSADPRQGTLPLKPPSGKKNPALPSEEELRALVPSYFLPPGSEFLGYYKMRLEHRRHPVDLGTHIYAVFFASLVVPEMRLFYWLPDTPDQVKLSSLSKNAFELLLAPIGDLELLSMVRGNPRGGKKRYLRWEKMPQGWPWTYEAQLEELDSVFYVIEPATQSGRSSGQVGHWSVRLDVREHPNWIDVGMNYPTVQEAKDAAEADVEDRFSLQLLGSVAKKRSNPGRSRQGKRRSS